MSDFSALTKTKLESEKAIKEQALKFKNTGVLFKEALAVLEEELESFQGVEFKRMKSLLTQIYFPLSRRVY